MDLTGMNSAVEADTSAAKSEPTMIDPENRSSETWIEEEQRKQYLYRLERESIHLMQRQTEESLDALLASQKPLESTPKPDLPKVSAEMLIERVRLLSSSLQSSTAPDLDRASISTLSNPQNLISTDEEGHTLARSTDSSEAVWTAVPKTDKLGILQARKHQLEGVQWLANLYNHGKSCILADSPGMGKTVTVALFFEFLKNARHCSLPHLMIVSSFLERHWERTLNRWSPSLKSVRIADESCLTQKFDVLIASPKTAAKFQDSLRKLEWSCLVLDELLQANFFTFASNCVKADFVLVLNWSDVLCSPLFMLKAVEAMSPRLLGSSFDELKEELQENQQALQNLALALRPLVLRRTLEETEGVSRSCVTTILYAGLSSVQVEMYQKILRAFVIPALKGGPKPEIREVLNLMMSMRQICNHPALADRLLRIERPLASAAEHTSMVQLSGKMILLEKILARFLESGLRFLVVSQMSLMFGIMHQHLEFKGVPHYIIQGSTPMADRERFVEEFNAPSSPIVGVLLSMRAGGIGLKFPNVDAIVVYDVGELHALEDFEPLLLFGKSAPVQIYKLVTENTLEESILEASFTRKHQTQMGFEDTQAVLQYLHHMSRGAHEINEMTEGNVTELDSLDVMLAKGQQRTAELLESVRTLHPPSNPVIEPSILQPR